jgi:glutamate synthase (NADPH/NADH) small chain
VTKLNPRRVGTRRLDPASRIASFDEMEQGYTLDEALAEAERCLHCPTQPCVIGCPANNHIPDFIAELCKGDLAAAASAVALASSFPAICSRVCDQARQCEGACVVGKRGDPVAIGRLERFVADWAQAQRPRHGSAAPHNGRSVAIAGAGPCGIAAALRLAELGYRVDLYDALPVVGGVLAWGIPAFRLPPGVLENERQRLAELGVVFHPGTRLGDDTGLDELFQQGADAVLLATGAPRAALLQTPGSGLPGVVTATDFLSAVRLRGEWPSARRVLVVGGGNTAMDAAQTALRLGAEQVTIVYRRSRAELRASASEIEVAEEEGVEFLFLETPIRFLEGSDGRLCAVRCCRMRLGEPGPDGRAVPQPIVDDPVDRPADLAILALGYGPDPEPPDIALDKRGYIRSDWPTGRTSRPRVWAGGDAVTGPDTVVAAMAWGRRAAGYIHRYLEEGGAWVS